jgi:hypothetical protein
MAKNWKNQTNRVLRRAGYEVVRVRRSAPGSNPSTVPGGDRLLRGPVFLLSSVRSGSTLLRMVLDSHSRLHAPHELHLSDLKVDLSTDYVAKAMAELGLEPRELEHLLWDRVLHYDLMRSGAQLIINKTPDDVLMWRRIAGCWRDARFIFLLRHPGAVVRSWHRARPHYSEDDAVDSVLRYMTRLEEARAELPGATVRYEDLTTDPQAVTHGLCEFLGVDWEPQMLDYGNAKDRTVKAGLGDWSDRIRSGRIQAGESTTPVEVPERLRRLAKTWGYVS